MKIKAKRLWEIRSSVQALLNTRFESAVSFRLRHLVKAVRSELEAIEKERTKLVEKHGEKGPDGNTTVQKPDALQAFTAAWHVLLEEEITLPDVTITIEEMGKGKMVLQGGTAGAIETTMTAEELVDIEEVVSYGTANK